MIYANFTCAQRSNVYHEQFRTAFFVGRAPQALHMTLKIDDSN